MISSQLIAKDIDQFLLDQKIAINKLSVTDFIAYNITVDDLLKVLTYVKNHTEFRFTILTDLFAVDFLGKEKRFEVVYNLLSLKLNRRLLIKVFVDEDELIPSAVNIFSAACWYEREIFDMFGLRFKDCKDMRRILTDYGFVGHPLRKDFPVTGHLEIKYSKELERVVYQPVQLDQEFRLFDFLSPWQGPKAVLPGDEKATK